MTTNTKQFEKVSKPETALGHKHTAAQQPEYKIGDWLHSRQAAGNLAIQRSMKQRLRVYPKLQVNQSTNAYEQEAESVAEKLRVQAIQRDWMSLKERILQQQPIHRHLLAL